jgi:hypothetical protein
MMAGIVAGQSAVAGAIYQVSFVSSSGASYIASGTSISSPSSPSVISDNDGLFAVLFARSALTPPSGWTLVASKAALGATAQSTYIYRKNTVTASDGSVGFTWTQSVSGRMGLAYIVCRSSTGLMVVDESSETNTSSSSSTTHNVDVPILISENDAELFIIASSAVIGNASPGVNVWTAASGASLRTISSQADNILSAATQSVSSGNSNSTPMTYTLSTAFVNEFATITIRIVSV